MISSEYPISQTHKRVLLRNSDQTKQTRTLSLTSDINKTDSKGLTPLHYIIIKYLTIHVNESTNTFIIRNFILTIESGANLEKQCIKGFTPLHYCCLLNLRNINDILSSELSYISKYLMTSYTKDQFTDFERNNLEILDKFAIIMLDYGASISMKNRHSYSPLFYTQLYYHIYPRKQKILLQYGKRNITIEQIFSLALLKILTPEENSTFYECVIVKHGLGHQHFSLEKVHTLSSIVDILMLLWKYFELKDLAYMYNTPNYYDKTFVPSDAGLSSKTILYTIGCIAFLANQIQSVNFNYIEEVIILFIAYWYNEKLCDKNDIFELINRILSYSSKKYFGTIIHNFLNLHDYSFKNVIYDYEKLFYKYPMLLISEKIIRVKRESRNIMLDLLFSQMNNISYKHNGSCLHIAANNRNWDLFSVLLEHYECYPYSVTSKNETAIDLFYKCLALEGRKREKNELMDIKKYIERHCKIPPLKTLAARVAVNIYNNRMYEKLLGKKTKLKQFIDLHNPRRKRDTIL